MRFVHIRCSLLVLVMAVAFCPQAFARRFDFQLERYEPTSPGSWTFAVDRPSYGGGRTPTVGMTLDYGHNPLLAGRLRSDGVFSSDAAVVSHQLVGRLEAAASFHERVQFAIFIPVTLLERGSAMEGIAPLNGMALGDPRLSLVARLWDHGDQNPFAIHAGGDLWIPIGADANHAGDTSLRIAPKLITTGLLRRHVTHSLSFGMLFRPTGEVSSDSINAAARIGHELHLGGAVGWTNLQQTWHAGLETVAATTMSHSEAFGQDSTSVDFLAGGQMRLLDSLWVGMAIGTAVMREPGTADFRMIARIAYVPAPKPEVAQPRPVESTVQAPAKEPPAPAKETAPVTKADPPADEPTDDAAVEDPCPESPVGTFPRPCRAVGALDDIDGDHVPDAVDRCPRLSAGKHPDPENVGCPLPDPTPPATP
jgi:hypothetical protein